MEAKSDFPRNCKPRKFCIGCGKKRMRSNFNKDRRATDGKKMTCKVCDAAETKRRKLAASKKKRYDRDTEGLWNINEDAIYC